MEGQRESTSEMEMGISTKTYKPCACFTVFRDWKGCSNQDLPSLRAPRAPLCLQTDTFLLLVQSTNESYLSLFTDFPAVRLLMTRCFPAHGNPEMLPIYAVPHGTYCVPHKRAIPHRELSYTTDTHHVPQTFTMYQILTMTTDSHHVPQTLTMCHRHSPCTTDTDHVSDIHRVPQTYHVS